jgi:hypothetical protein
MTITDEARKIIGTLHEKPAADPDGIVRKAEENLAYMYRQLGLPEKDAGITIRGRDSDEYYSYGENDDPLRVLGVAISQPIAGAKNQPAGATHLLDICREATSAKGTRKILPGEQGGFTYNILDQHLVQSDGLGFLSALAGFDKTRMDEIVATARAQMQETAKCYSDGRIVIADEARAAMSRRPLKDQEDLSDIAERAQRNLSRMYKKTGVPGEAAVIRIMPEGSIGMKGDDIDVWIALPAAPSDPNLLDSRALHLLGFLENRLIEQRLGFSYMRDSEPGNGHYYYMNKIRSGGLRVLKIIGEMGDQEMKVMEQRIIEEHRSMGGTPSKTG